MKNTETKIKRFLPVELTKNGKNTSLPTRYTKENGLEKEKKNQHAFVVDWQISDEEL